MSSHRKDGERAPNDFYPTPQECSDTLVSLLQLEPDHLALEPSAGSGRFVTSIMAHEGAPRLHALELFGDRYLGLANLGMDRLFTGTPFEHFFPEERYDWIIGNPPFSLAAEHVQQAMFLLKEGGKLAFLLRAGFSHTKGRNELIQRFPPWREYGLVERPPFDGSGGSDSSEYVFYVWKRGHTGRTIREYVSWKNPELRARDIARVRRLDWTE